MNASGGSLRSIEWRDGVITIIDQTVLPHEVVMLHLDHVDGVVDAIKRLAVRGAPALGVMGGYGVALAVRLHPPATDGEAFAAAVGRIRNARPTAVNLARMVDRVLAAVEAFGGDPAAVLAEADRIRDEELQASIDMGERGADLVTELVGDTPVRAMTICNTGGLATVERGTALAVIQTLHERGRLAEALPVETRPLLQGGRLTTWELERMGAPYRLAVDGAGPFLLSRGAADVVLIGADRVAANGDTANKVGSFSLSLGAAHAGVPFIVVAPESTVDVATPDGAAIEIEDRGPDEVRAVGAQRITPATAPAVNPAFDVTPRSLITALVTDQRVVRFDRGDEITPAFPGAGT